MKTPFPNSKNKDISLKIPLPTKPNSTTSAPSLPPVFGHEKSKVILDKIVIKETDTDINDILNIENSETNRDFEARKKLTLKLISITDLKINNVTAVTLGFMIMKKAKMGISYDKEIEDLISYLLTII